MHEDTLLAAHAALLESSAITREAWAAAGVWSAAELPPEFAGHPLAAAPALVFPWRRPDGQVVNQLRPDVPRPGRDGRPAKYLFPPGAPSVVGVHPDMAARVADASVPLVIVEGPKQYLAVVSWLGDGHAAVAVAGCRNWSRDGVPSEDLAGLPLDGRQVITCLDADVSTNRDVHDAAALLARVLESLGAAGVRHMIVPATRTAGIDDYLAAVPQDHRAAVLARLIASAGSLPRRPAAKKVAAVADGKSDRYPETVPDLGSSGGSGGNATPEDGAALLDAVIGAITTHIAFRDQLHAVAVTLYAAATHAVRELQVAPRLVVKSPVKRCGKSRLLDVLMCLARRPLPSASASAASVARSIGADPCTIIMDEQDTVFGRDARSERAEDLRGILNSGFTRRYPYVRYNASTGQVEHWPTFAMVVLAAIGDLPDTVEDRAVIIPLARKTAGASVVKFRDRVHVPALCDLGARLAAWVGPLAGQIGAAMPAMPPGMSDRAEDVWEPLIAVADAAGAHWPGLARAAAAGMAAEAAAADAESSTAVRLLADAREVFADTHALHSVMITARLAGLDGAPWADYDHGRPLNGRQLADMLRPFGIRSRQVKIGGVNLRGYYRADFGDAWSRYPAPGAGVGATAATAATAQVSNGFEVADGPAHPLPPLPSPYLAQSPAPVAAPGLPAPAYTDDQLALLARLREAARP